MRRRLATTLLAVLTGAGVLAVVPLGIHPAQGQGEPTMAVSQTEGVTGRPIRVTGTGCFLPDGVTGADGLLIQLIAPDGSAAASATLTVERDGTWDSGWVVPRSVEVGTYSVRGTCIAPMYEDLGVLTAGTFTVTGQGPPAREREPNTPRFPDDIEPYPRYDGQSTCSPDAKPGMVAFRDMILAAYPASTSFGISRDCSIGGTSEHKEGRAWDWGNNASETAGRRRVANFLRWLFATDQYGHRHAMARRLGVMYIIWNREIFRMYRANEGWTPYTGSSPHTDHVHISLTRKGGAKRTSFWTMQMGGPNPPDPEPNPNPNKGPRAEFERTERTVNGDYDFAESGDFDGNGKLDILWYGQGTKPEEIWYGRRGRGFVHADITARGRFRPLTGDYDGDGRTDILWYAPGAAQDYLWFGRTDRTWETTEGQHRRPLPQDHGRGLRRRRPRRHLLVRPGRRCGQALVRPGRRALREPDPSTSAAPTGRPSGTSTATVAPTCSGTPPVTPRTTSTSAGPTARSTRPCARSPSTPARWSPTSTATAGTISSGTGPATAWTRSGGVVPTAGSRWARWTT